MTTTRPTVDPATSDVETPAPGASHGYWRSLRQLAEPSAGQDALRDEFPEGASELEVTPVDRRGFLGVMGASLALAGATLSGCVRKPKEKILPYASRPEDLIPGRPKYYATATAIGPTVLGLVVESQEGRPTKIEGNPRHPNSSGATNLWAQAEVLRLYDPDRSRTPARGKEGGAPAPATVTELEAFLKEHLGKLRGDGTGLALLLSWRPSPTLQKLVAEFRTAYPKATVHLHDAAYPAGDRAATALLGQGQLQPVYAVDRAKVVLTLDCDFLGTEGDMVRATRGFAAGRRVRSERDEMNRLYTVEPMLTITGGMADHRLPLAASQVGAFARALAAELFRKGVNPPTGAQELVSKLGGTSEAFGKWIPAVAADLARQRGQSLVLVGERQPAWVHALGHLLNAALGNVGRTVTYTAHEEGPAEGIEALAKAMRAGQVKTLVMLGGNPVYDAPADLEFGAALKQVPTSIHQSLYPDETSRASSWHVPASHFLEAWGDLRAKDGTTSVQQPLIAPLFGTWSELEFLARVVGSPVLDGHQLVKRGAAAQYKGQLDFERFWRRTLHDGVMAGSSAPPVSPTFNWAALAGTLPAAAAASGGLELAFQLDESVYDGRYANAGWLQEYPDPVSKLTWDNAALVGPVTAKRLGLADGDLVELSVQGRKLKIAAFTVPGTVENTVVVPLGYGRTAAGKVGNGRGFNAYALRTTQGLGFAGGAALAKLGGTYKLVTTQEYGQLVEPQTGRRRPLIREATLAEYRKDPAFVKKDEAIPAEKITSLSHRSVETGGQQWGMVIDLNACTGCGACLVGCQAENNIPVVGKERVANGREMHWIRIDRYFEGSMETPRMVYQPVPCMHCENAPCEPVCPVTATSHSADGMNDMIYNRCIGTRYCANNCPYKVRRFNYFNFTKENDARSPLLAMQRNPDVTVRFRGVMEKCSYCVQRIMEAKAESKRQGHGVVADGAVVPACAQVCPAQAIVFGDINDPKSAVASAKRDSRHYGLLTEVNTQPRTTYLGSLRNPNPELA
ncbi:MAG: TAT-variant-translocated molybdopterin oxidoreductase [Deltaproteobacteria bacterium]|nr:TAT-variant-translocated molybdopterin oxidoreductase [Deltaproteobacteria bacterium]